MREIRSNKPFGVFTKLLAVIIVTLGLFPLPVHAENAPAYTYTMSVNDTWARTQDAYLTGGTLFKDMGLNKPEDIFISGNKIYIADTGNGRVAIIDKEKETVSYIGKGELSSPTGVFVDDVGQILVADNQLQKVALYSPDGKLIKWYARPTSPTFGKNTTFKPKKVTCDKRGNIFIVSEGSYDGIIQLSKEGEFLGYFGINETHMSPLVVIENLIFTKEQKAKLFSIIPKSFYNVAIDKKGMVYSATQSFKGNSIKKHSVAGENILSTKNEMIDERNFVDLWVGTFGQVYTVTETGLIYEYDSSGNLVFSFGGRAISSEKNGLFTVVSGVASDENDNVYVLDKERGVVQVFFPTVFADMTHSAINLFGSGKYGESKDLWTKILQLSGTSRIAYNGLGKAYFQANNYEKAAQYFKTAKNVSDYSDSYWEIRNMWIQNNTVYIIVILVVLLIIWNVLKLIDKRIQIFNPIRQAKKEVLKNKLARDLVFIKSFIKHPINSMYDIKTDKNGSILAATIIYFVALVIFTVNLVGRGFIFNKIDMRYISYVVVIIIFILPVALLVLGNYMVSSINDGEGRLKDVYCATAYAFAPFIIYMPIVILLSYVLTVNEKFILEFASGFIWLWCLIILFLGLKEVHVYEIKETIKSILLTIFIMCIAIIVYSIVYMLWDQLIDFVYSIIKEVTYNVRKY